MEASTGYKTIPEIFVDPEKTPVSSDSESSESSDDKSLSSKTSDENFRPTHHLVIPQLKHSNSASSLSSYASSTPNTPNEKPLTEENIFSLGESGALAQSWYTSGGGTIHSDGRWFRDEQSRTCLMRGVNLCGNSKLPTKPNGSSHLIEGFFDHRNVSFIGRPFHLEEVHQHFARLRTWGLTFVRLLVTWEALEHSGPGIYDEEFIEYLINIIEEMPRYGIRCFIDPHQDCWSRFSGGSGAPGWTFEIAGLDMNQFKTTGAAYVHNTNHKPGDFLPMVWPTNYTKLASSTMFTLFWGGDVFAPESLYEGVNVKEFLQDKYINYAVMGFELMNEPHPGYIGLSDLFKYDAGTTLVFGDSPNALQSFALGDGIPQEIEVWIRSWPFPTRKHSTRLVNEERVSAWINDECIWRKHGVWDVDVKTGKPKVLNKKYFTQHPITGKKVDFYKDFYLPFVKRYSEGIQSVKSDYLVFVEPLPNEPPPKWTTSDHHKNVVYAPHWYDLQALFTKSFDGIITHDVQRLTQGPQHIMSATYFGISGAKKNYFGQVRNIVKKGLENVGDKPCVIGECGIPMDINDKKAFATGDYTHHINFLDAVLIAMEKNLVNFTLWNYNSSNDNTHGDHWYGEDFSIYSPLPSTPTCTENSLISETSEMKSEISKLASEMMTTNSTYGTNGTNGTIESIKTNGQPLNKLKSRAQQQLKIHTFTDYDDHKDQVFLDASEEIQIQDTLETSIDTLETSISSDSYDECKSVLSQMSPTTPTSPFDLNPWQLGEQDEERYYDPSHHDGGRVLDAVLRPYAAKAPGVPQTMAFNIKTKEFTFKFTNYSSSQRVNDNISSNIVAPEVEIFIPNYHYKKSGIEIRVSDGDWRYVRNRQTLYWRVKDWISENLVHSLRIRIIDDDDKTIAATSGSVELSNDINKYNFEDPSSGSFNVKVVLGSLFILFLAIYTQRKHLEIFL
ncbi:9167_t:CDS:2 [Diversispora eburnea]|uniref:9167_t:CDS:1 n=1 Tax=Diversispora eburnea TaxID=1213867 RepID=A0A9N8YMS9_9GLOM|nr:9167_t:CDS:2 [Diversispora eburnea]